MRTVALLIGFLAIAACGGKDDSSATLPPASSPAPTPPVTTSPTSTAAPSDTTAPSTTGQPATSEPTSTTNLSTTAPPATTAAPPSGPTPGVAVVYAALKSIDRKGQAVRIADVMEETHAKIGSALPKTA